MYFPVAGIEASPFSPICFAFGISLMCSMTGISGAFLLLPYQISILGYTAPGVSATNQIFNILACPAGVLRYAREGRLLLPLAFFIALGTLPGVFVGALVRVSYLTRPEHFMLFASLVLFYLGIRMLFSKKAAKGQDKGGGLNDKCLVTSFSARGFSFSFRGENHHVSSPALVSLAAIVGLIGGIYGVGGGAIMVPFLVSFFGLPVHAIAGASLFATFLTSVAGVGFYSLLANVCNYPFAAPDWGLGILLGIGGIAGMYCGASLQKYLSAKFLRYLLILIVLSMGCRYLVQSLMALLK